MQLRNNVQHNAKRHGQCDSAGFTRSIRNFRKKSFEAVAFEEGTAVSDFYISLQTWDKNLSARARAVTLI